MEMLILKKSPDNQLHHPLSSSSSDVLQVIHLHWLACGGEGLKHPRVRHNQGQTRLVFEPLSEGNRAQTGRTRADSVHMANNFLSYSVLIEN